jgi:fluoroquinolone transport system permease protein
MSFLVVVMPALVGMVIGFLLLDQRDDQTLAALQVTPLTLNGYLIYR